jgi:transposase InsO family protein
MLVELSMVEQRYQAVREVLDTGASITEVAIRYGVDRRTLHRWLNRYADGGLSALADRSSKPDRCPHQIDPAVEARIIALRLLHPMWGPRTLLAKLRKEFDPPPSRSSIYRALVRQGLIDPKSRKRKKNDYKRWERSRSMELWQMDVVGCIYLRDGTKLSAVTGIDDHSRFCVIAKLVERATARPVCDALMEGLKRHGVPDQILTDNGKVFTGRLMQKPAIVLFDRICHNNEIKRLLTAPYSPTTTGKIERLHRTMRREFFDLNVFDTIEDTQAALDEWVKHYNTEREHQSIGDVTPVKRFALAKPRTLDVVDGDVDIQIEAPPPSPKRTVMRRVDTCGRASILKHRYHLGRYLAGALVEVKARNGVLIFSHNGTVVATHAKRHLADDDERMYGKPKAPRPQKPTFGTEVMRLVDSHGSLSFAATQYRVGNKFKGRQAGVRVVDDTVQITVDGELVRTHRARHDPTKAFSAFGTPNGRPKRSNGVA